MPGLPELVIRQIVERVREAGKLRWSVALARWVTWDTRLENRDAIHQALHGGVVERLPPCTEIARLDPGRLPPATASRRGDAQRRLSWPRRVWDAVAGCS